ncbi:two-component system sensor histidine kinase NtrB [Marinivivus vitaminiproducens]|uniref:two-component system sensor histidine kinase NtrB n=1 Tax=Marinivivus vitaminiproducens TaxID=3035935 RepID=UPI0027A8C557|nr:ATP-binding protein [Geminicoccaceae bacterium SCSIO 64248]
MVLSSSLDGPLLSQAVLSGMSSPVLVIDDRMRVQFVNPAAEQMFALSAPVLLDRFVVDLLSFDSPLIDLIRRVQLSGSSLSEYGVTLIQPTGAVHAVDIHLGPMPDRHDDVLAVLHPCSVARKLDQQMTHRGAARSIVTLAATLAHEVKNPLSGIRGAAQLLEEAAVGEDKALTQLICAETDRICALVDRMEAFSDPRPIERKPVNIHQVLEHVRRLAEHGFARHVRFDERYDPSLPEVDGDRNKLIQVFLNLVKNAAEATPRQGGEIVLSTHYQHGMRLSLSNSRERVALPITVQVRDNGSGVPEDIVGTLFDPFVTAKSNGSGLGLSLVAKFIGDHGGTIEFENEIRGATFTVRLPAWRGPITSDES